MRYLDEDESKELNADPWQLDLLKLNPSYISWGPHEDYMWTKDDSTAWNSRVIKETWTDFGPWELDDLNECVNFYFEVNRTSGSCETCGGNGTHIDAQWISESFYSHSSPFKLQTHGEMQAEAIMSRFGGEPRRALAFGGYPSEELLEKYGPAFQEFCERMRWRGHWNDDITEDEAEALIAEGRAQAGETAVSINMQNAPGAQSLGHDVTNRWILVKRRLERLGLPQSCPTCFGHGHVYTAPVAHISLILWWLHPRKGCSRGIEITRIEQSELPAVYKFLREASARNAARFARIPDFGETEQI